jgi:phenylacetate-CoA ligase
MSIMLSEETFQTAGREEIEAVQLHHLKATLDRVSRHVPHYQRAFQAIGFDPGDFDSLERLAQLPLTTKDDLRANYPFGMFAAPSEEIARIHASSGTTGKPTVVGYTRGDLGTWSKLMMRTLRLAGVRRHDKIHNAFGYGLFTGGLGVHAAGEALGCTVVPVSGGMTARQVRLINDFRPDVICATPSYLLTIADEFVRQNLNSRNCSLRLAICGAEPWSEGVREELEDRLGLVAVDIYGLSELLGPGVAQEFAGTREGPTIFEDHFLPEIIDPVTGAVLPDGESGELVLTSLTREAMPMIRYRTRDLTRLLPGTASKMRRIQRIKGRCDDMMIIRGVNVFPTQIEEIVAADPSLALQYVIEITRPDRLDVVRVRVESRTSMGDEAAAEAAKRTETAIKDLIGVTVSVDVVAPGVIPRSEGKAVRIIDNRPKH